MSDDYAGRLTGTLVPLGSVRQLSAVAARRLDQRPQEAPQASLQASDGPLSTQRQAELLVAFLRGQDLIQRRDIQKAEKVLAHALTYVPALRQR